MYLDDILAKIDEQEPEKEKQEPAPDPEKKEEPGKQTTKLQYCDDFMKAFAKDS